MKQNLLNEAANETAQVNNQVNNSNNKEMNNTINFSSVLGESAVAHTATVDEKVVNDLFHAFMEIPQVVSVRF